MDNGDKYWRCCPEKSHDEVERILESLITAPIELFFSLARDSTMVQFPREKRVFALTLSYRHLFKLVFIPNFI